MKPVNERLDDLEKGLRDVRRDVSDLRDSAIPKVLSDVKDELKSTVKAVEVHIAKMLLPVNEALPKLLAFMAAQDDRDKVRLQLKMESRAEFTAEQAREDSRVSALLGQHKLAAEITGVHSKIAIDTVAIPSSIDGAHRRRWVSIGILVPLVVALLGLISAAFISHPSSPPALPALPPLPPLPQLPPLPPLPPRH